MANFELKGLKGLRQLNHIGCESNEPVDLNNLQYLPINALTPNQFQPRKHFDEQGLQELAASIQSQGIIQPLIVRKILPKSLTTEPTDQASSLDRTKNYQFEIVAGERRWQAAKLAGLNEVPVIIKKLDDHLALAFAIIENIQREDLTPLDEAVAFEQLKQEFSMTHQQIAVMLGRSRASITNSLRLLSLNDSVKLYLKQKKLEMGHARALLSLSNDQQLELANKIITESLTVRETELLVQKLNSVVKKNPDQRHLKSHYFLDWSQRLAEKIARKVSITVTKQGRGKIMIHTESAEEIEWLINHLNIK